MNDMNLDMPAPMQQSIKPKETTTYGTVEEWVNNHGWGSAQETLNKVLGGKEVEPDSTRLAMKILDIKTKLEKLSSGSDGKDTSPLDIMREFFNDPANQNP
jgi:hypothetical protein